MQYFNLIFYIWIINTFNSNLVYDDKFFYFRVKINEFLKI